MRPGDATPRFARVENTGCCSQSAPSPTSVTHIYPNSLSCAHKSADHAGSRERLPGARRPLNRVDTLVQSKRNSGGGLQTILAHDLQALSPQSGRGRYEKIARGAVLAGSFNSVFRHLL